MKGLFAISGPGLVLWVAFLCRGGVYAQGLCQAMFTFQTLSCALSVTSTSVAPFDTIVAYIWEWGDGTSPDTFSGPFALHLYAQSDTYTVCHTIITSRGCQNTFCQNVVITNCGAGAFCNAAFEVGSSGCLLAVRNTSFAAPGDSLELSVVDWGDGSRDTLLQNLTAHSYFQNGQYVVCLSITTREGCADSVCDTVVLTDCVPASIPENQEWLFLGRSIVLFFLDGRGVPAVPQRWDTPPAVVISVDGEKRLVLPR